MRIETYLEARKLFRPAPTRSLLFLRQALKTRDHRLVRDSWGEGENGCIVQHLGRFHPACRQTLDYGLNYLALCGVTGELYDADRGTICGSYLVHDFDMRDVTEVELARLIASELRDRGVLRPRVRGERQATARKVAR